MELKVRTGYDEAGKAIVVGIEIDGKIASQIVFPLGMESIIAEAVLSQARLVREGNISSIIKPGLTDVSKIHDLTNIRQGEKPC